jgi:hypothetical protein
MRATRVVEAEVRRQRFARLGAVVAGMQVDLFALDAAPQSFDEHVVDPATFAVHADGDAGLLQDCDPVITGELPWSVLKTSGAPNLEIASSRASTQKSAVMVSGWC